MAHKCNVDVKSVKAYLEILTPCMPITKFLETHKSCKKKLKSSHILPILIKLQYTSHRLELFCTCRNTIY